MSDVIEKVREKYPQYKDVPDDELTVRLGTKYPSYLDNHPEFKSDFTRLTRTTTNAPATVTQTTPPVPEKLPDTPTSTGFRPAIRLVGGDVVVGDAGTTHPDIIQRDDLRATDIDQRGFVNEAGEFHDREQTAAATGLPTNRENGRQHSTDLPEAAAAGIKGAVDATQAVIRTVGIPAAGEASKMGQEQGAALRRQQEASLGGVGPETSLGAAPETAKAVDPLFGQGVKIPDTTETDKIVAQAIEHSKGMDVPVVPLGDWIIKAKGEGKSKAEEGINESLRGTLNGLTTPGNLALMGASMGVATTSKVAARLVSAIWAAFMGKGTVEDAIKLKEELAKPNPDTKEVARLLTSTGTSAAFTGLAGAHAAGVVGDVREAGSKAAIDRTDKAFTEGAAKAADIMGIAKAGAPLTAKALAEVSTLKPKEPDVAPVSKVEGDKTESKKPADAATSGVGVGDVQSKAQEGGKAAEPTAPAAIPEKPAEVTPPATKAAPEPTTPTEAQEPTIISNIKTLTPAIRGGARPVTGRAHAEVRDKITASKDPEAILAAMDQTNEGFVDQDGKFVSRQDAYKWFKAQFPDYKVKLEDEQKLSSEDLKAKELLGHLDEVAEQPPVPETKIVHEDQAGIHSSRYIWAVVDGRPWKIRIADHPEGMSSAPPLPEVSKARKENLSKEASIPNENPFTLSWQTDNPAAIAFEDVSRIIRQKVSDEFFTHEDAKYGGEVSVKGDATNPSIEVEGGFEKTAEAPPKTPTTASAPVEGVKDPPPVPAAVKKEVEMPEAQKQRSGFDSKAAKAQKKFLLDEASKAADEAPSWPADEEIKAWRESPEFQDFQRAGKWHNDSARPLQPQRHSFSGENAEQEYTVAIDKWGQEAKAWMDKGHSDMADLARKYNILPNADAASQISTESLKAFYERQPHVTIDIPGDGSFSVLNTKEALVKFKEKAEKFPTSAPRAKKASTPKSEPTNAAPIGKLDNESISKALKSVVSDDPTREVIHNLWSDGKDTIATNGRMLVRIKKGIGGTEKNPLVQTPEGKKADKSVKFPNWKQVVPETPPMVAKDLDTARLFTILKQADQATSDRSVSVKIYKNKDGSIGMSSESPDEASYSHNIQEDAKLVAAIDPKYFITAINAARMIGDEKIDLHSADELSPIVLRSKNTESVIMPMRLEGQRPTVTPKASSADNRIAAAQDKSVHDVWRDQYVRQLERVKDSLAPGVSGVANAQEVVRTAKMLEMPKAKIAEDLMTHGMTKENADYVLKNYKEPEGPVTGEAGAGEGGIDTGALGTSGMGGAKPGEFTESPNTPTSIKNATVDTERAKRGLPPAMQPAKRSFGDVWDQAMARIDQDPGVQDQLIDDLRENPRALTDVEDALLLHRQIDLQNQYGKATREMAQAFDDAKEFPNRMDAVRDYKLQTARLSDQLLDLYNIGKRVGTETGRGLNARKMMAYEDYTLAKMELEKRAANGGRPLTDEEHAEITALNKKIEATQKAYDEYVARTEAEKATRAMDTTVADLKRDLTLEQAATRKYRSLIDQFAAPIHREADAARARLKERLGRTNISVDPTVLYDLGVIGMSHILRGAAALEGFTAKMVSEFGEGIKEHVPAIFEKANQLLDERAKKHTPGVQEAVKQVVGKKDTKADVKAKLEKRINDNKKNTITPLVQKLARMFVEEGVTEREPLIDAVHGVLKEIAPDFTRRETMDAISGYGNFHQLTKDDVSVQLRDLKGQMQQVAKLEDITAKKPLLKSGVERRPQSDAERRLIQQVNEAKRRFGVIITDPAKQLKSALDAIKTNLRNRISDLEYQIDSGKRIVKTKTGTPYDAEALALKAKRDALKEQFDQLFGKPQMTDAQRLKMAMSAVEKSIGEYERRIKEGDFTPGVKAKTPLNAPELDAARARRDALKEQFKELQQADPSFRADQDAKSLQSLKTGLANRTADLKERLARGDFETKARRTTLLDPEALRLKAENERAKQNFQAGLIADRLKNRVWWEKALDWGTKWRRAGILSSPVVIPKLISAGIQRMTFSPMEEITGSGFGRLPGIAGIASKAPLEGGFNLHAESRAFTQAFSKGIEDAWQVLKTGKSDLDTLYGKRGESYTGESPLGEAPLEFFGRLHGLIKAPVKRAAFERATQKLTDYYAKQGMDPADPLVAARIGIEAYKAANRSIFLQDNFIADRVKRFINSFEERTKATGHPTMLGKTISTAGRFALPILKVPTNIVAESIQYSTGLATGSIRVGKAMAKGVETLKSEEADLIMRDLKKGTIGAAFLMLGYLSPNLVGGYYQPGKKQKPGDVKYGSVRIYGHDIPSVLLHNPLLETVQLGATIRRVADSHLRKKDTEAQGLSAGVMAGAIGLTEEVPFIREMSDLEKMRNPYTRPGYVDEQIKSVLIPQVVQWIAKQGDKDARGETVQRDPKTLGQHLETGIPGLRHRVPVKKGAPQPAGTTNAPTIDWNQLYR